MSKELEALEVLKQLKDFVLEFVKNGLDRMFVDGSFDIIETALKEHEEHKQILNDYGLSLVDFRHACFTFAQFKNSKGFEGVENKLKALEIIKKYTYSGGWSGDYTTEYWKMNQKEIKMIDELFKGVSINS